MRRALRRFDALMWVAGAGLVRIAGEIGYYAYLYFQPNGIVN